MGLKIFVRIIIILIPVFIFLFNDISFAQQDTIVINQPFRITLKNDFEAKGIVREITSDTIYLETEDRTLKIPRKDILTIRNLSSEITVIDSSRLIPDPNESRLMLGPTGKTLKGGKAYISTAVFFPYFVIPLFFPFSSFGITDYINIGAGASPLLPIFYFAPKVRALHTENINVSFGFIYGETFKYKNIHSENFGVLYGVSTYDFENYYSLSIGAGMAYTIDWENKSKIYSYGFPHILIGFEMQTAKDYKLFSENWINLGQKYGLNFSVLSIGARSFGKNFAFDYAIIGILTSASLDVGGGGNHDIKLILMPWVSLAYNFNL